MVKEPGAGNRIRVTRDSYQILRESFRSDQYQPVDSLQAAYRRHRDAVCSQGLSYFLRCCSNVFVVFVITISFLYVVLSLEATALIWKSSLAKNLMLTPYINKGNLSEARALSKVELFYGITSYSGFLTVDETCKSHLFFWFFPAAVSWTVGVLFFFLW